MLILLIIKMVWKFFKVAFESQTYLNMFYLLLAFPLGLVYFVILVTGLSVGIGTIITLIGIPIIILMTLVWYWLAMFERFATINILNIKIGKISNNALKEKNVWRQLIKHLSNTGVWKSFIYLMLKFPIGIISFVLLVSLISVSLSLIISPLMYNVGLDNPEVKFMIYEGVNMVPNFISSLGWSIVGIILLFASLHLFNGIAYISGLLAQFLLRSDNHRKKGSGKKANKNKEGKQNKEIVEGKKVVKSKKKVKKK
jgi:hypothetical protein